MEFETKILSKGIQEMLYNSDKTVGTAEIGRASCRERA